MQQIITEKQARAITGGRKPLVPVVYEQAVKALAECLTLDDAKQWDNKADALAAWAKIYHDGKVERQAKALKLLAYKRMGDIARELHGDTRAYKCGESVYRRSGAHATLKGLGLSVASADASLTLSRADKKIINSLLEKPSVPAPTTAAINLRRRGSAAWIAFNTNTGASNGFSVLRKLDAKKLAMEMSLDEARRAMECVCAAAEWCDEFLQHCEARLKKGK